MEPLLIRLATAPVRVTAGTWLGVAAGGILSDAGYQDAEFSGAVDIEPARISIAEDDPNAVLVPVYGGDPRLYPLGVPRRRLALDLSGVSSATMRAIYRLIRSNRPLAIGAYHDDSTLWMSRFGGQSQDGDLFVGVAEVGDCAAGQVARRSLFDFVPSPVAGFNVMRQLPVDSGGNNRPKIVPGMIGSAISLSAARRNVAPARFATSGTPLFTKFGTTVGGVNAYLRHNFLKAAPSEAYVIPFTTSLADGIEIPSATVVASTYYTVSIFARGRGSVTLGALNGSTTLNSTNYTLTDDWQRLTVEATTQGGQTALKFRIYASGALGASLQVTGLQVEAGYGATDLNDFGTAPSQADSVVVRETLPMSGFTLAWWFKFEDNAETKYLFSANLGAAGAVYAHIVGTTITAVFGHSTVRVIPSGLAGTWMQIVIVFGGGVITPGNAASVTVYCNGAALGSFNPGSGLNLYPSTSAQHSIYVGSDSGLASPAGFGFNLPIDRFRLDARTWSAAETAADYRRLTDPGIAGLLELIEGRYFRVGSGWDPQGPFLDSLEQRLTLTEVGVARQGVY